jgi:nucleoside-diphosphate-sugar epimerase
MERGGPTLAPGPSDISMQFIDVRDLVEFIVDGAEKKLSGPYNMTSERGHMFYGGFLETMNQTAGNKAELCWLEPERFKTSGVEYWTELPNSIAPGRGVICQADTKKAVGKGLKIRPAVETITDTWRG